MRRTFATWSNPTAMKGDPFKTIVQFRDQLARRGIKLMILPMPGKPSIYSDELTYRTIGSSPTQQLIARLGDAGVETVDLFQSSVYAPGVETVRATWLGTLIGPAQRRSSRRNW